MKKPKKTVLQDGENFYRALFGEESICETKNENVTLKELNESIADCQAMLDYATDLNDKEEIAFWRKMLQRAKCDRREMLATA